MIRPEDYRFVNFADGTMPTDRINGEIMPLRDNKRIIKGEDVAFAYEAACDRLTAFDGAETILSGGRSVYHSDAVEKLIPTKSISAEQTNGVIDVLSRSFALASSSDVLKPKFLASDLSEGSVVNASSYQYRLDNIDPHFVSGKESSDVAKVLRGDMLKLETYEKVYGEIAELSRPTLCVFTYLEKLSPDQLTLIKWSGDRRSMPEDSYYTGIGSVVYFTSMSGSKGVSYYVGPRRKIFSVPKEVEVVRIWVLSEITRSFYSSPLRGCAMFVATGYFTPVESGDSTEYWLDVNASTHLVERTHALIGFDYPDENPTPTTISSYYWNDIGMTLFVECKFANTNI